MAPPKRHVSRPLMHAAGAPLLPPRGLMSNEAGSFAGFDPQVELMRLLWGGAVVIATVLYLFHLSA
ncbi:MAG: hypothetical protein ACJ768_06110 [Gaiellaceae bacterium]